MTKTTQIYNQQASEFIGRYDNAEMSHLHTLFLKYLKPQGSVLDIGFGSGRDLQFLYNNGFDIWGIDPSKKFVENTIERFSAQKNHFFTESLPFDKKQFETDLTFDAVIAIAMWMHLERSNYADAVASIANVASMTATVVISYSEGSRTHDERYFEEVDLSYLTELFKAKGYHLVERVKHKDSLDRDSLTWITVVFKNGSQEAYSE